jgi:hypothetical protein
LLANVALHGLENAIVSAVPNRICSEGKMKRWAPTVIRYADDFVRREARFVYDAKVHLPLVVERQVYPPNLWAEQLAGQG